jgi:polyhydroxyalkanoate synthesis regulator phasin
MKDELRRWALMGSGVAELTRNRAEQIVKDMVAAGDVKRKQGSKVVKDLMETSKANRQEFLKIVRSEIQGQIQNLGLATQRDLERLERRVARLESSVSSARKKNTARKTTAKKSTTRKTTAKKTTARKSTVAPPPSTETTGGPTRS